MIGLRKSVCRRRGYTLLEIMVVVLLLGLFISVALPAFVKIRTTAREKEASVQLELIAAAVRQLAWDTGRWPHGDVKTELHTEVWDLTVPAAGLLDTNGSYPGWKGPYLPDIPADPWGSKYFFDPRYRVGGVTRIVVGSFGPNRRGPKLYDSDDIYIIIE